MKQKIQSINRKSLIRLHQNVKVLVKKDCKEKGRLWTIGANNRKRKDLSIERKKDSQLQRENSDQDRNEVKNEYFVH